MKIVHKSKEYLLITHTPWKLPLFLLLWALLITYMLIKQYHSLENFELFTLILSILMLLFSAYATSKKASMKFDAKNQLVTWHKEGLFKKTKGTFNFHDIKKIFNRHIEDTDGISYRVEIALKNGEFIPVVWHSSTVERQEEVSKTIKEWLAQESQKNALSLASPL